MDSTPMKATITFNAENPLQRAANYSSVWCDQNEMCLNATKSNMITFTLRKTIDSEPLTINGTEVVEQDHVKLLGVTFDRHVKFSVHVDHSIAKSKPAFHALVQLKRSGVRSSDLTFFYNSRILSIVTYAAPCWFPYTTSHDREKLEKYQNSAYELYYHMLRTTASDCPHCSSPLLPSAWKIYV